MNKRMLHSKMKLFGDTNASLATYIGISPSRLSAKINGYKDAEFTQSEMDAIRNRYLLSDTEFTSIFFAHGVS